MKPLLLLLIIAPFLTSCIQKRFLHNAPPVLNPMIKEKGEGFGSAYYHTNGASSTTGANDVLYDTKSNGINLQGGYAFAKKFAVAGSVSNLSQKSFYADLYSTPFDTSFVNYKRNEFTLACDFFVTNDSKKAGLNLLLGATTGKLKIDDHGRASNADYNRYFNANQFSLFLAPCFNMYIGDNTALGFNTKFAYLSYNNNKTNYTSAELSELRLDQTSSIFISELGIKLAIGFNNIPLSIDGQLNYIINNTSRAFMRKANFSTGICYRWNQKQKKK